MSNRITFDTSINIEPFRRRAIDEITEITNTFFDATNSRNKTTKY